MQTHEKIAVTKYTIEEVETLYAFDKKRSKLIAETLGSETFKFGPYERTYWFKNNLRFIVITHTQLQFDENWVEPEEVE